MPRLVTLHVLADGGGDFLGGAALGLAGPDDKGLGDFAGAGVRDGDDGAVGHEGVREEVGF